MDRRSFLSRIFRPPPAVPEQTTPVAEWPQYDVFGWTLEQVQSALESLSRGYVRSGESLLLAMKRDPIFLHGYKTRANAAATVAHTLTAPDGLPAEPFADLQAHLPRLWHGGGSNSRAVVTGYRPALGMAPVCVTWGLSPSGRTWIPTLHAREPGWLTYQSDQGCYQFQGREAQHDVVSDGKSWILLTEMSSNYPHLDGNVRALAVAWWYKHALWRYWFTYGRTHGSAQRKFKHPAAQREQRQPDGSLGDVARLHMRIRDMLGGEVVPLPQYPDGHPQFDFELVEAKSATWETFPAAIDYIDRWITLCWLGATDNTQGGGAGSRARAEVHERVSLRYLAADCATEGAQLDVLWRQWCRYNRIAEHLAPKNVYAWEPPADRKEEAQVRQVNADALGKAAAAGQVIEGRGVPVDWRALAEAHGVVTLPGALPVAQLAPAAPGPPIS